MEKAILNHHASTVLAKCEETGEFLFGKYDEGYPGKNKHWIGRVKLLGGNYFCGKDKDISPRATLIREIEEEFSGKNAAEGEMSVSQTHSFASLDEIKKVREALSCIEPFQDYFAHFPALKPIEYAVQSVYRVFISKQIMNIIKENLEDNKSLINEGCLAVHTLDDIVAGNPMTQGITGLIMGHAEKKIVPHCFKDSFSFVPLGKTRENYLAYSDIFEYFNHSKK